MLNHSPDPADSNVSQPNAIDQAVTEVRSTLFDPVDPEIFLSAALDAMCSRIRDAKQASLAPEPEWSNGDSFRASAAALHALRAAGVSDPKPYLLRWWILEVFTTDFQSEFENLIAFDDRGVLLMLKPLIRAAAVLRFAPRGVPVTHMHNISNLVRLARMFLEFETQRLSKSSH